MTHDDDDDATTTIILNHDVNIEINYHDEMTINKIDFDYLNSHDADNEYDLINAIERAQQIHNKNEILKRADNSVNKNNVLQIKNILSNSNINFIATYNATSKITTIRFSEITIVCEMMFITINDINFEFEHDHNAQQFMNAIKSAQQTIIMNECVEQIAQEHFNITLIERKHDSFDNHELSIHAIRDALTHAYNEGKKSNV